MLCSGLSAQHIPMDYTEFKTKHEKTGIKSFYNAKPDVLKSGFIDINSFGDMQASAQFLKFYIGEPGVFSIPFIIYTGTVGNPLSTEGLNQNTISNILNPIGGLVNGSFDSEFNLLASDTYKYTKLKAAVQFGGKLLNATDSLTNEKKSFGSFYANAGFRFQTGAWSDDDTDNIGMFWFQGKAFLNYADEDIFNKVFNNTLSPLQYGFQADMGIFINKVVNIKLNMSQFLTSDINPLTQKPVFKLSIDYSLLNK